jgi:hypothetical protein
MRLVAWGTLLVLLLALVGCQKPGEETNGAPENGAPGSDSAVVFAVTLTAENVTPTGLTLVCRAAADSDTSELQTGSAFVLQKRTDAGWVDVESLQKESEVIWISVAWLIPKGETTRWDVTWDWLYGELAAGEYRIGKEIVNFRGLGDYEQTTAYATFEVN